MAVLPLLTLCAGLSALAQDGNVVFRSDVSLVRVDAQVVDRDNRAITGLRMEDFILREEGKPQQIRNFASEDMPVDVLLLLDVSASMRPHVQRIADAAHDALRVLGANDRVAIMVFDRSTRVRMPFRSNRGDVERAFQSLLDQETFNGGTDITRGLLDAARYIGREGRRDARRAIVILTDDMTERNRDEAAVGRALTSADAVLSALIAPDAMRNRRGGYGGGRPGGGTWPGGGGGMGGPLGGIILGRRGGYPGRGPGGPGTMGSHTQSAGTSEIARRSGGDSMPVDDAAAFENTLARIRQRYALHFYLPPGLKAGQERNIEVDLADAARRRYPGAEVRFRRTYMAPGGTQSSDSDPVVVTQAPTTAEHSQTASRGDTPAEDPDAPRLRRRPAVNQVPDNDRGPNPSISNTGAAAAPAPAADSSQAPNRGSWRRVKPGDLEPADNAPAPDSKAAPPPAAPSQSAPAPAADDASKAPNSGGWRRLKPGEQP